MTVIILRALTVSCIFTVVSGSMQARSKCRCYLQYGSRGVSVLVLALDREAHGCMNRVTNVLVIRRRAVKKLGERQLRNSNDLPAHLVLGWMSLFV